jgi:hypothetical protein
VCYVQRGVKGDAIVGLRLVAERSEEVWVAPPTKENGSLTADVTAAAAWLTGRLKPAGNHLDVMCLDTEGSLCGWMSAPSADPDVLGVLARQFGETPGHEGHAQRSALAESAASREEASVALLGETPSFSRKGRGKQAAPRPVRAAVLAVSDVPARLLADALDERGLNVGIVTTIWHALASVWDPSARRAATEPGTAEVASHPTTAVIAADPTGRLVWAWSSGGTLLAGGSMRVPSERLVNDGAIVEAGRTASFPTRDAGPSHHVVIGTREASRLAAEWLAWSLELGRSPVRIIAVIPAPPPGRETEYEAGLAAFGQSLTSALPGATMDLAEDRDPLGTTLTRLAERIDDAPGGKASPAMGSIPALTMRPTRAHRRFYIMASLAVASVAAAAGTYAYALRAEAGRAQAAALSAIESWRPLVREIDAKMLDNVEAVADKLGTELTKLQTEASSIKGRNRNEIRPVMDELATITMIFGDPEIHLTDVTFDNSGVIVKVLASLEQATAIEQALKEISGSNLTGWQSTSNPGRGGDGFEYSFRGTWISPDAANAKPDVPKPTPAAAPKPAPAAAPSITGGKS